MSASRCATRGASRSCSAAACAARCKSASFVGPRERPLDAAQWQALLAIWSVVHGFAHLGLAGQLDRLAGAEGPEAYVRRMLGPMLQQLLDGLSLRRQRGTPAT